MGELSHLIRQLRLHKDWSIRKAAGMMGISHSYLSTLEKGLDKRTGKVYHPKPETLKIVAQIYDYPYEELLKVAGYIECEAITNKKPDQEVFWGNLRLIMGNMDSYRLSKDIFEKTGYQIPASQIEGYLNGKRQLLPGILQILSKYAGVNPDFWYHKNTLETWKKEKLAYNNHVIKSSCIPVNNGYYLYTTIQKDIRNWLESDESVPYVKLAMQAQKNKVSTSSLKMLIDIMATKQEDA